MPFPSWQNCCVACVASRQAAEDDERVRPSKAMAPVQVVEIVPPSGLGEHPSTLQGMLWCAPLRHGVRRQGLRGHCVREAAGRPCQVHEVQGRVHGFLWPAGHRVHRLCSAPRPAPPGCAWPQGERRAVGRGFEHGERGGNTGKGGYTPLREGPSLDFPSSRSRS